MKHNIQKTSFQCVVIPYAEYDMLIVLIDNKHSLHFLESCEIVPLSPLTRLDLLHDELHRQIRKSSPTRIELVGKWYVAFPDITETEWGCVESWAGMLLTAHVWGFYYGECRCMCASVVVI